jgi:hypothetical protein
LVVPDREIRGAAALAEFTAGAPRGVHFQGLRRLGHGILRVTSNFVFVNAVAYAVTAEEYYDDVRRDDVGLYFARRAITIKIRTSDAPPIA